MPDIKCKEARDDCKYVWDDSRSCSRVLSGDSSSDSVEWHVVGGDSVCERCNTPLPSGWACNCAVVKPLPSISFAEVSSGYTIEELYNELGSTRWSGDSSEWDNAIDVVREFIRGKVS